MLQRIVKTYVATTILIDAKCIFLSDNVINDIAQSYILSITIGAI